jgi:hypothetical protein
MGVGDVGLQTSELAHHLYQLGTNRAPSLHDLTAMHLLGDRSDALTEPTLPVDVAGDHQQEDLAKQIFAADWRVHGTLTRDTSVWAGVENRKRSPAGSNSSPLVWLSF